MILLKLEDSEQVHGFHDISVDGYSEEQVFYHIKLLHDAGLIEAIDGSSLSGLRWFAQCLTWAGHEFLDSTRNETIWNRAKARVAGAHRNTHHVAALEFLKERHGALRLKLVNLALACGDVV